MITINLISEEDKNLSCKIKEFENRERGIADLEHYGRNDIDFSKKFFKLVAKNDSWEILGILNLEIEIDIAFIDYLLVNSLHRRSWVWTKLLHEAEKISWDNNCSKIYLETNEWWWAVNFYYKNNYEKTWVHEKHVLGQNTFIFTKFFNK